MLEQLDFIKEYSLYKEKHILNGLKDPLMMDDKEKVYFLIEFIKEYFSFIELLSPNEHSKFSEENISNNLSQILSKYNKKDNLKDKINFKIKQNKIELSETFTTIDKTLKAITDNHINNILNYDDKNKEITKLKDEVKILSENSLCKKCLNQSPLKSSFRQNSCSLKKKNTSDSSFGLKENKKQSKFKIDRLKSLQISKEDKICSYIINLKSYNQFKPPLLKNITKEQNLEFSDVEDKNKLRYIISFNELALDPFTKSNNSQVFYSVKNDILNEYNKKVYNQGSPFIQNNETNELKSYLDEVSCVSDKISQRKKSVRRESLLFNRKRSSISLLGNTKDSFLAESCVNPSQSQYKKTKSKKRDTIIYAEFDNEESSHVNCQMFDNDISALFKINDNAYIKIKGSDCKVLASMIFDYLEYDKVNIKLDKAKKYVKDVKELLNII